MAPYRLSLTTASEVAQLLQTTWQLYPPSHLATPNVALRPGAAHRIGAYLLSFGYLQPTQLVTALTHQQKIDATHESLFVGDILIQHRLIQPAVLVSILMVQMVDRLLDPNRTTPLRMGEYLVATGALSPSLLARALLTQTDLRQQNKSIPLGEILIQQGILPPQVVNTTVTNWTFANW
ncbi:MAG: hypothetical protein HC828_18455 [Blastochloris sp.]|nr:hypothetical protein [Blastochloris sp.]